MVKSNLCWLNILDKTDCHFDYGGYFVIKGAEKVNPVDSLAYFILCFDLPQFIHF